MNFFNKNADKLIILWILVLSILYATLSILRHNHFQSGGFDLGLYDQTIWKYSQFLSPYNTIKDQFILGDHLNLTLPLIAPLYYLWNDVRILLIFQAFWISFSSLAIYKICKKRSFSPFVSFNLTFVYSLFYGIQYAVFFDFHAVIIGVGLIPWLAYFIETRRKKLVIISTVLLLLTQENMGIAISCLGLIYFFRSEYRKLAISFILGGFLFSLLAAKAIDFFSSIGFQYNPQINLNPTNILIGFFDTEEKRQVWLYSLTSFSFLPLFAFGPMAAVFLDLAQYFVTGPEFSRMWSPFMHHRAILAPFLLLGTLETMKLLNRLTFKYHRLNQIFNFNNVSIFLVIMALIYQFIFHYPLNKLTKSIYWQNETWMNDNNQLFKLIPPTASLATSQNLIPHLSHRKEIYLVWPRKHDKGWWLDFGGKPEYLIVDLHPNQWLTQLLETNENFGTAVDNMENIGKIRLVRKVNEAKLYKINY